MNASRTAILTAMKMLRKEYETFCNKNDVGDIPRRSIMSVLEKIQTSMYFTTTDDITDSYYALQAAKSIIDSAKAIESANEK